ncbi:MAG TPA: hypothetical protein PLN21_07525 [Gemmatales bacterium]|nr:hypothetical protein [Gemmatales bacterium]
MLLLFQNPQDEPPLPSEPEKLIQELGAKQFARREAAGKALEAIGEPALPPLSKALEDKDVEIRKRADRLFATISEKISKRFLLKELHNVGTVINDVAFTSDGKQVIGVTFRGKGHIWDVGSGEPTVELPQQQYIVPSVAISPDGKHCMIGSMHQFKVCNIKTGEEVLIQPMNKASLLWSVLYTRDGKRAVVSGSFGMIRLYDLEKKELVREYEGFKARVWSTSLSSDGKLLAAGSGSVFDKQMPQDNSIRLWEVETGKEVKRLIGHSSDVRRVLFHPDGKHLVSCSFDKTIRLWNLDTGKEVRKFEGHQAFVEGIQISRDGKRLYSCSGSVLDGGERAPSNDHSIIVWDIATSKQLVRMVAHQAQVKNIALSPDSTMLASCSEDGTVRLWKTP